MMIQIIPEIVCSVLFFVIGMIVERVINKKNTPTKAGIFNINMTDPNKDSIHIELQIPIGEMIKSDKIVFDVKIDES